MRNESFPIDMGKYKIIITQNNMQVNYVKNIKIPHAYVPKLVLRNSENAGHPSKLLSLFIPVKWLCSKVHWSCFKHDFAFWKSH